MVTFSIIRKSQLEGAHRLDAEYYQPEYLENEKLLAKIGFRLIGDIGSVVYGTTPPGASFVEKGTPFIRSQNFSNLTVDDSNIVYASEEFHSRNKKSAARPGDILFAAVGATIGELAIIQKSISEANINQNIAKVRINKEFNPYFVGIFFASRIGQLQISRLVTGNAQAYLNSLQIREFKIPKFPLNKQEEVTSYFMEIERTLEQSKSFYSQAEDLLLEELGLKDFKPEEDLSYVVNLSDAKSCHRIDAEYFQPKYEKLISKIKNQKSKLLDLVSLNEICSIRRGDFIDPDYYVEKSRQAYVRIKELPTKGDINLDAITYIDDNFSNKNLDTLSEGDFVFAGIGATLGKTARTPKELEGAFYSNNTARFRIRKEWKDKIDTYYLQVVLQSIVCQRQFEQRQAQTAQAKIADEELKTVLVPILPERTQQKIADLVRKSHEARKKAKALLEEAKQKVEKAISGEN